MELSAVESRARAAAAEREAALRPDERRRHGVVHTPPALARFVVRGVDALLRERFGLQAGIAQPGVALLDPACGPGAFLAAALAVAPGRRLLLRGLDRDAAALVRCRHALAPEVEASGSSLSLIETDALADAAGWAPSADTQVLAVVGNPPWSVAAARASPHMRDLLQDFRLDHAGARLAERKLGVLSDSYVRFVRAVAEVARGRRCAVGLVTSSAFLDGLVHRGMRAALLRWFSELSFVDLGGNALLSRGRFARRPDANVFGVRPGVVVTFAVSGQAGRAGCRARYLRVDGDRQDKLTWLAGAELPRLPWLSLQPAPPAVRFVPTPPRPARYERAWPLPDCLPFHREGVQSNRDALVVDADPARLLARLRALVVGELRVEPKPHFDPARARAAVLRALERDPAGKLGVSVRPLAYRPFHPCFFAPIAPLCHRPRPELLRAVDASSLVLLAVRKDRGSAAYRHFAAVRQVADSSFLSARSSCRTRCFPTHAPDGSENLSAALRRELGERLGEAPSAETFILYALAVLAAPAYRDAFAEHLPLDYPRLPLPRTASQLRALAQVGASLHAAFDAPLSPLETPNDRHHEIDRLARAADPVVEQLLGA